MSRHRAYRALRLALGVLLLVALLIGSPPEGVRAGSPGPDLPDPLPCPDCALPPDARAQYQLTPAAGHDSTGGIVVDVAARPFRSQVRETAVVFDIDLYVDSEVAGEGDVLNSAAVEAIHDRAGYAICYVSAGSWEKWRPDAGAFPAKIRGKKNGWPGERWLDISDIETLAPIMSERVTRCVEAGFDAVEWDNVDGYRNDTGFDLQGSDQLEYNVFLANLAHEHGLAVGLKNDLGQIEKLVAYFDFAMNEQCSQYNECDRLRPFLDVGKPVFQVEYEKKPRGFCPAAIRAGRNAMFKAYRLGAKPWTPCS